jgi:hypothetical protein
MIIKTIVLSVFLFVNCLTNKMTPQVVNDSEVYEIIKTQSYQGKNLEAVYKINYKNKLTNHIRFFEVIKTDSYIKNHFLADFLLIEKAKNNQEFIFYPTGWESIKAIKESELKETCQLVIKGEISPEAIK